jgi:hypothetical protein
MTPVVRIETPSLQECPDPNTEPVNILGELNLLII